MISVILPAFNEEKNIEKSVKDISNFFAQKKIDYEIIVVNDGSTDKTGEILLNSKFDIVVSHLKNLGYGATLRSGFARARGDLIFFTDADCQFDIVDIEKFLEKIKEYDFVIGYRKNRKDAAIRIFYGFLFGLVCRIFFGVKARDVDCAFKLFKKKVIENLKLSENGALINLEILAQAQKHNYKFLELPVNHFPRKNGKQTGGSFKVIFLATKNIFSLYEKLFQK